MFVKRLSLENFRNIESMNLFPAEGVNVIFGENAQGKTNVLESIWLMTGCKSFRARRDREMVRVDAPFAKADMEFFSAGRTQNVILFIDRHRTAMLNGVTLQSSAELVGTFSAVVFSPAHLSLVQAGPLERRRFLDTALCQLKPLYAKALARYNRTLAQRNALLKDIKDHPELVDTLPVWDEKLAAYGAAILTERLAYVETLSSIAAGIYEGLSGGRETLSVRYLTNLSTEGRDAYGLRELLLQKLAALTRADIYGGATSVGPHRDDLQFEINGMPARVFGSQGQQRSTALALKLAEARLVKAQTGEEPVILLDDVMSELDESRQDYILNHIQSRQVFITCCEPTAVLRLCEGRTFHLEGGRLL